MVKATEETQRRPVRTASFSDEPPTVATHRAIWQIPLGNLRSGLTVLGTLVGLILLQPLMAVLGNVAFIGLIFVWYYRGLESEQQQQLERWAVDWLRKILRSLRGSRRNQRRK